MLEILGLEIANKLCYNKAMERNLDMKYMDYLHNTKRHCNAVVSNGCAYRKILKEHQLILPNGSILYFKQPHSRALKRDLAFKRIKDYIIEKDNILATINELMMQESYRQLGIATAEHFPILLSPDNKTNDALGVVSEDFTGTDLEYTTLYDLFCKYNLVSTYQNSINNETSALTKENTGHLYIDSPSLLLFGGCSRFEHILDNRYQLLQIMTEECFNQLVAYYMLSVFDFSDDDHLLNAYLYKKKGEDKFSGLYLFDKESASYIYPIAEGRKYGDVLKKTFNYDNYNGYIRMDKVSEKYNDRRMEILRLAREGILAPIYIETLEKISNFDYNNIAKIVQNKHNLIPDPIQVDILKYGAEQAGIVVQKSR